MSLDERALQFAAAALEKKWLDLATDAELRTITESGKRPDLLEKDEGGLRILFGFDVGSDGSTLEVLTPDQHEEALGSAVELVFARTRLRARLKLPAEDCGARRPNPDCTCLTQTLDELGEEADRETIVASARKRHVPRRRFRASKPKAVAPPAVVSIAAEPPLALPRGDDPPDPPNPPQEQEHWRPRNAEEPADPLSPYAFRNSQDPLRIDWLTKEF